MLTMCVSGKSGDHTQPIRGQYMGQVITLSQWEASIQVTWSLSANERPVSRSRDHSQPMRGWVPGCLARLVTMQTGHRAELRLSVDKLEKFLTSSSQDFNIHWSLGFRSIEIKMKLEGKNLSVLKLMEKMLLIFHLFNCSGVVERLSISCHLSHSSNYVLSGSRKQNYYHSAPVTFVSLSCLYCIITEQPSRG